MQKLQKINGKIQKITKNLKVKTVEVINDIILPVRSLTTAKCAEALGSAATKQIFDERYAVNSVVLRAGKNEDGTVFIYGTTFKTIVNESPYVKAIVEANGDFKKTDTVPQEIMHWNTKTKELVLDYKINCNKRNDKGRIVYNTNVFCIVDFSMLETDLNSIYKFKKKKVQRAKKDILNSVFNCGIDMNNTAKNVTLAGKNIKEDHSLYEILSWSPSNERSETALFCSLDPQDSFQILNKVSGGTLSNAICKNRNMEELIKFSKRLGQLSAPSRSMGEFGNDKYGCMIYMHETEGPEDFEETEKAKLAKIGINIDRNTMDGAVVVHCEFAKDFYTSIGKKISLSQANLLAFQTRCSVLLSKVFGECKSDMNMKFRAARYKAMVPKERILEVAAGTDVSNYDKKDYDLIIVGNPDKIAIIMDKNGSKALKDISLQKIVDGHFMNYILDVAKCSETQTSGQMIQKFMAISKEATIRILKAKMDAQFDGSLTKYLDGDLDAINSSLTHFLLRHCEEALDNTEVLKDLISTELDRIDSQLKNYKVAVDSVFLRALFDDSYFVTNGAIDSVLGSSKYTGKLEAYSYDVELRHKDQIDAIYADDTIVNKEEALDKLLTGVAFKFPSPSADESVSLTFKTGKVLAERIANMNMLTKQQREVLLDDFINTSFGVIKMAPSNTIKHRLAGMDTDYDGVAIVFEKELVDLVLDNTKDKDGHTTIKSV
ncbi:MAG: hypothetical protein ACRCX8_10265 [Sarcina sp.]